MSGLGRRVGRLEGVPGAEVAKSERDRYDLSCFSDDEVEELAILAEKAARMGAGVSWTAEETAALGRLQAKHDAAVGRA